MSATRRLSWLSPLLAVSYGVALRFFALRVWTLALAAPLAAGAFAGAWAAIEGGRAAGIERAALVLLGCLHHLLPPLAAIFILAPSDQEGLDLLRARPLGWPSLLLGRWLGASALFGGCHLALAAALWAVAAAAGGGPGGRLYREASERSLLPAAGEPRSAEGLSRPWPSGPPERSWIEAVEGARGYIFLFEGLEPGREQRARIWVLAAQVLTHRESGESPGGAPPAPAARHRELARSNSLGLEVSFHDPERRDWMSGERLLVYDEGPTDFAVPARAVGRDGKLRVRVAPAGDSPEGVPGMIVGKRFFWFDPAGGDDPVLWRDLRIVVGEVSFAGNAFRAALEALGKLVLVTAVAVAATALFSSGVAIGVVLTVYLFSSAAPFLREAVDTLQSQSALLLLDPHGHHAALKPSAFERGLKVFLESLTAILPDFSRFNGLRRLDSGEAIRWSGIARAAASAAAYALAALGLAAGALAGRDLRR